MTLAAATTDDDTQRLDIARDATAETATLSFSQPLALGTHRLRMAFKANKFVRINSFGRGLFFVDYPTDHGVKRMLSSHLGAAERMTLLAAHLT